MWVTGAWLHYFLCKITVKFHDIYLQILESKSPSCPLLSHYLCSIRSFTSLHGPRKNLLTWVNSFPLKRQSLGILSHSQPANMVLRNLQSRGFDTLCVFGSEALAAHRSVVSLLPALLTSASFPGCWRVSNRKAEKVRSGQGICTNSGPCSRGKPSWAHLSAVGSSRPSFCKRLLLPEPGGNHARAHWKLMGPLQCSPRSE
jgi:hypothetical protein